MIVYYPCRGKECADFQSARRAPFIFRFSGSFPLSCCFPQFSFFLISKFSSSVHLQLPSFHFLVIARITFFFYLSARRVK